MKNLRAYLLLGSALLLCPCHLPLVIGLLVAGGLGGGMPAGFLSENMAWLIVFASAYFVFAVWAGIRLLNRTAAANPVKPGAPDSCCSPVGSGFSRHITGGDH